MKKKEQEKVVPPRLKTYSEAFKKMVVAEYEKGVLNKDTLMRKYNIGGKSQILEWCRKYGKLPYRPIGILAGPVMKDPQKQRIKELEKQLAQRDKELAASRVYAEELEKELREAEVKKQDTGPQKDSAHPSRQK